MGSVGSAGNTIPEKDVKAALEYYQMDGYYINNILRGNGDLDDKEKYYIKVLDKATQDDVKHDTLYRVVDYNVVFGKLSDIDADNMRAHLLFGDDAYDKGAYSQGIKARMNEIVNRINTGETTLPDKGYMSTTYDLEEATKKQFDQTHSNMYGIVLKITNARDLKGAEIGGDEKEVLLKRNYKYKFKKIQNEKGTPVVITEIY